MDTVRTRYRLVCVLGIAGALALATAGENRAHARGGAGLGGAAVVGLVILAIPAAVVGVAIDLALKAGGYERRPADSLPAERKGESTATTSPDRSSDEAHRAFLALPRCEAVGGYEAYRRRTGEVCRLY